MTADLTELARAELEASMHRALTRAYRHGVRAGVVTGQARPGASPGHEARTATPPEILASDVGNTLERADEYARRLAADEVGNALDDRARERRLSAAEASAAEHLERLGRAEHSPASPERTGRQA